MTSIATTEKRKTSNPVVILLGILFLAAALTYFVDSGAYKRADGHVVPGSFETIEKDKSPANIIRTDRAPGVAYPVSFSETLMAIPEGLERSAGLIFMVLIIGGMFGILTTTGAIDAGLARLLGLVRGEIYFLVPGLMIVFSAGSTFLGLASEYLLVIPLMVTMANRMGMSNLIGLAIVTVATKVGYLASVTNPLPLTVAQPLVGLPVFSGAGVRFGFYLVFLAIGIAFVLMMIKREGVDTRVGADMHGEKLSLSHTLMLTSLVAGVAVLVYASNRWHWHHTALSAFYIGLSMLLAAFSGLGANKAAEAFVGGMKKVLMAAALIGVATAVSVVLQKGQVLDTVVNFLTGLVGDGGPIVAAQGMFFSQLFLDFLIPSTSGQAAVSMPILGPIGQLSGVEPQTTVLAFLFGNGLTNMITPTSGTLLAYLATAEVGWARWARFILPLWLVFSGVAMVLLTVAVMIRF
ncbi:MAG: YfcC family protein [Alphaproteobacteria bacterium]|nr:MAG: YfcC family protein [Alphaproteobacteria bacterium]